MTLADAGVEFVVGGGVACVLHGVGCAKSRPFDSRSGAAHLQPRVPVSLADIGDPDFVRSMVMEKGALVFSLADFNNPLRHLDIFLSPVLSFERLNKGAKWFDIGGAKVRVASKELLLQIKNEITPLRPKDVLDVQELSRLIEEESR